MKRLALLLTALLLIGMVFGGQLVAQDETPKSGGTLVAAWEAEWATLDPHLGTAASSFYVIANVAETLTTFDDEIKLVPALATSWEQSEDGLTWTFHLREGVKFSNGRDFTAEDVKWSFERIISPELGSGWKEKVGGEQAVFEVIDPYTITITTPTPNGILPISVAAASTSIIAQESLDENGQVVIPIGTGPFYIEEINGTTSMMLRKNPYYWQEGLPYLDAVDIRVIPEDIPREAALLGGEVDWNMEVPPQSYEALKDNADIVLAETPLLNYQYMALNFNSPPLNDRRVRQAIAYAIDRDLICEVAEFGLCTPIQGPTGPGSPWYFDYAPYTRDVEKAKALLAEAGYPDGFTIRIMPTITYDFTMRSAQVVQQQLAEVGITLELIAPEWAQWLETRNKGDWDIFVCGWTGLIDVEEYYYLQQRTGQIFNRTGYSNPEFDALVDEGRTLSDFDTRYKIYEEANKILVDDAPYVYFYSPLGLRAWAPYVKGYVLRSDLDARFTKVWLDK